MKKRITALALVLMICLAFESTALAIPGALTCTSNVKNGNSYAKLTAGYPETLYVSFSVYKIEGTREVFQCSASNSGTGVTVSASSTKALSSGNYVMYISGYGNTVTVDETRYYSI